MTKRAWTNDGLGQRDKAESDFAAAVRVDPDDAEAHSGLGYVRALRKLTPDAQRQADLALLHGGNNYMVLHNVACIYSALSETDVQQAQLHQEVAMALLRRAVKLWKEMGGPNEITLIKGDPAFKCLKDRPDFKKLIEKEDR